MQLKVGLPAQIEQESFAIITRELGDRVLDVSAAPIIKRVIHTTADFDYADNLYFSPDVIATALETLQKGALIISDTNMARSGVNQTMLQHFGGETRCFIADSDIVSAAKQNGTTRAVASMDKAAALDDTRPMILVIGNAPTALIRLVELWQNKQIQPAFVVGAPVGFVNVVESKELLKQSGIPSIIAQGRKGGSNVAAAICNALLYMAAEKNGIGR